MLFSSIPFLYYFLPSVLILYFLAPQKLKNTVLLISSLVFYGWGEPKYVIMMVASIIIGFVSGLLIEATNEKSKKKLIITINIIINLGFLVFFKYSNFFIENFNSVTGLSLNLLNVALPIGISFYTFQILSYAVDVYRGTVKAQKNLINLATYITMFPQLIAGPIVRYSDIVDSLTERKIGFEKISTGLRRFIIGLSKKVLLANALGELCVTFKASDDKSLLFYWLYAVAFCLQVYFDFSGYSDMAIGLGKILGFEFMENFNFPFISKSISEFWRRWHISLGSWFRDYVYIPLGGNRVKKTRWIFNILVVWFLTGFWHGAAWNFIIWGLYFVIFLIFEKTPVGKFVTKTHVLNRVYTLFFIIMSFVIFDAVNMSEAFNYIKAMLGASGVPLVSTEFIYYLKEYLIILVLSLVGATPLVKKIATRLTEIKGVKTLVGILEPIVLIALLVLVTAYLVDGSFNPFLYFRF
ncbi:MAG: MBOAT family protein [Ruminococcaceae bacterium]|nr:MBOAT family protein [Oscillospiraceae bacterium]